MRTILLYEVLITISLVSVVKYLYVAKQIKIIIDILEIKCHFVYNISKLYEINPNKYPANLQEDQPARSL